MSASLSIYVTVCPLQSLIRLGEWEEATALVAELLEEAPEAADLLFLEARLLFLTQVLYIHIYR